MHAEDVLQGDKLNSYFSLTRTETWAHCVYNLTDFYETWMEEGSRPRLTLGADPA